jgi:stage II sporulation SpoE-like protein/GAF domain-containing protein
VSDYRDVTAACDALPAYLPATEPAFAGSPHDLAEVARLAFETVVPRFADAASMFLLEELLSGGGPVGRSAGTRVVARRLGSKFTQPGRTAVEAAFPPGEVTAFAADSACARCVRDGAPMIFSQPDGKTLELISPGARKVLAHYASFLAVPMMVHDAPIGFLIAARAPDKPTFGDRDAVAAARLAAHAGTDIDNYLSLLRQRSVTDALQPRQPAASQYVLSELEIAGRCRPAAGCEVGGDWYDIIGLPDDRVGIIVGDVMGHGTQAAAVMSQLSAAAYTLADLDLPPAEVMRQLNRTALALPHSTLATCAYAVIDPGDQSCALATAGHLPPVLAMPDGNTRVPCIPGGQSLGVGTATYGQARIRLRPGATLALYTDGLVETRTRPFDQGILALRSVLAQARGSLDDACDALVGSLGMRYEDDITVVLARIGSG